jgi:CRP-like cAMP-binding protein
MQELVIRLSEFAAGNARERDMDEKHFELWARSVGGKPEQFAAGQTIFSQGESGNRMYIVRSGAVDILVNGSLSKQSSRTASSGKWP